MIAFQNFCSFHPEGFPGGTVVKKKKKKKNKKTPANCRRCRRCGFGLWVRKIPWRRKGNPLQYSCLQIPWTEEPRGLQSTGSHRVVHSWAHTHTHPTQKRYFWVRSGCIFSSLGIYTPARSALHAMHDSFLFPTAALGVCFITQACLTLCDSLDSKLPGCSIHGISQARTLEWVAISSSRASSWPRDWTHISTVSCVAGGFFTHWAIGEAHGCITKL